MSDPEGSPPAPEAPFRLSLRRLMLVIALVAAGFAWLDGLVATASAFIVAIAVLCPRSVRWRNTELAASTAWLVWAAATFSNVFVDLGEEFGPFAVGVVLGLSWVARVFACGKEPRSFADVAALAFTPAVGLLGVVLLGTDVDFHARLALCEPALLARARETPPDEHQYDSEHPRRVGLFWAKAVEEREGCVLWTTGGFMASAGLAYVPTAAPPNWKDYKFEHVRGPWWRFVHDDF